MKKIALTLAALAALSTASFAAGNRNWDLQDREYFTSSAVSDAAYTAASPLAIEVGSGISNFERLNKNAAKNELSSH